MKTLVFSYLFPYCKTAIRTCITFFMVLFFYILVSLNWYLCAIKLCHYKYSPVVLLLFIKIYCFDLYLLVTRHFLLRCIRKIYFIANTRNFQSTIECTLNDLLCLSATNMPNILWNPPIKLGFSFWNSNGRQFQSKYLTLK